MTTKEKIQFAMDKVPTLTDFGIGLYEEVRTLLNGYIQLLK